MTEDTGQTLMDRSTIELIAEMAAQRAIDKHEGANVKRLSEFKSEIQSELIHAVKVHALECPAKTTIANVKWLLIGAFGSGVAGGGTFGAWLASALIKASPSTTWMQDVINKVFG